MDLIFFKKFRFYLLSLPSLETNIGKSAGIFKLKRSVHFRLRKLRRFLRPLILQITKPRLFSCRTDYIMKINRSANSHFRCKGSSADRFELAYIAALWFRA